MVSATATAQTPIPRVGESCPSGTYRSGDYCNAVEDVSPIFPLGSLQELKLLQNPLIPCDQLEELEATLPATRVLAQCGG
jgi:hypothetical protein